MAEEYDSDAFAIRVSQKLFHALAGKAAEPGPIEARSRREAALIEAVRKEGRREKMQLLHTLKKDALKSALEREESAHLAFSDRSTELDEKLRRVDVAVESTSADGSPKPCESFRNAVTACYKENASGNILACAPQVEAFTECAKQLCNITHN